MRSHAIISSYSRSANNKDQNPRVHVVCEYGISVSGMSFTVFANTGM